MRIVLRAGVTLAHGPAELFDALLADRRSRPLVAGRPAPEVVTLAAPMASFVDAAARLGVLPVVNQPAAPARDWSKPAKPAACACWPPAPACTCTATWLPLPTRPEMAAIRSRPKAFPAPRGPGSPPPTMLRQLEKIHRGPLPAGLIPRVKAWAHHYGDGALEDVVLLQLDNPAILAELMGEPDMADLLSPFQPSRGRALARVRRKDLETLRARLAERGIHLKDNLA